MLISHRRIIDDEGLVLHVLQMVLICLAFLEMGLLQTLNLSRVISFLLIQLLMCCSLQILES